MKLTHKINTEESGRDQMWLVKLKILTLWPFIEKFADSCPGKHPVACRLECAFSQSVELMENQPTGLHAEFFLLNLSI